MDEYDLRIMESPVDLNEKVWVPAPEDWNDRPFIKGPQKKIVDRLLGVLDLFRAENHLEAPWEEPLGFISEEILSRRIEENTDIVGPRIAEEFHRQNIFTLADVLVMHQNTQIYVDGLPPCSGTGTDTRCREFVPIQFLQSKIYKKFFNDQVLSIPQKKRIKARMAFLKAQSGRESLERA